MQNPAATLQTWLPHFLTKRITPTTKPKTLTQPSEWLTTRDSLSQAIDYYRHQEQLMALTISRPMGRTVTRERLIGYLQSSLQDNDTLIFHDVDNRVQRVLPASAILTLQAINL